jgi:hypothetical protein
MGEKVDNSGQTTDNRVRVSLAGYFTRGFGMQKEKDNAEAQSARRFRRAGMAKNRIRDTGELSG